MKVKVFNVQRFSVHDGPGIRTTVFMQGCPLRCKWCHNPESHEQKPQLNFYESKCVSCQACASVCNAHSFTEKGHIIDRTNCKACKKCVETCLYDALEVVGYETETDEIITAVLRDSVFYKNSGGGITLSGGEPFTQEKQALELIEKAKQNGINVCVETCGYAKSETLLKASKNVDLFLYDIKETNPDSHREFTGVDNKLIFKNLKMLDDAGAKIIVRLPIIPSLNDRNDHYEGVAKLLSNLKNLVAVEVMAYHSLGVSKYSALGKVAKYDNKQNMSNALKKQVIKALKEKISNYTNKKITVK